MNPRLHIPADLLLQHALGQTSEPVAILIETHLTLCPRCRADLALAESMAAEQLVADSAVPPDFDALLRRLDEPAPVSPSTPTQSSPFPAPIADRIVGDWRWLAPYIQGVDLDVATEGLPMRVIRMSAGAYLPHRDGGVERAVVLSGGWTDQDGHVGAGDFSWTESREGVHEQRIDPGEDCVTLVWNDARGKPTGPLSLIGRWFKI